MLAIIGGSGLTQLVEPRRHRAQSGAHALRRALGRAHLRAACADARRCSSRATATATRSRRTRSTTARTSGRCARKGRREIVSVASVGGIRADLGPGALVVPHQIIDYTWGRRSTFFEGGDEPVTHIDFTRRTPSWLRQKLLAAARACGEPVVDGGVYAATQGRGSNGRRDRPAGARRRRHGRHDRHAGSGARARARRSPTPRSRWS